jgi:hypothetical protein
MSLAAINDKFGLGVDAALIAAIWVGIALISTPIVTAAGVAAGVFGIVQTLIIRNESV